MRWTWGGETFPSSSLNVFQSSPSAWLYQLQHHQIYCRWDNVGVWKSCSCSLESCIFIFSFLFHPKVDPGLFPRTWTSRTPAWVDLQQIMKINVLFNFISLNFGIYRDKTDQLKHALRAGWARWFKPGPRGLTLGRCPTESSSWWSQVYEPNGKNGKREEGMSRWRVCVMERKVHSSHRTLLTAQEMQAASFFFWSSLSQIFPSLSKGLDLFFLMVEVLLNVSSC